MHQTSLGYQSIHPKLQQALFKTAEDITLGEIDKYTLQAQLESNSLAIPEPTNESLHVDIPSSLDSLILSKWLPYKDRLISFIQGGIPNKPLVDSILIQPGWTRYEGNHTESVPFPLEDTYIIDTETLVKLDNLPVMAACVSNAAWYFWLHPTLCGNVSPSAEEFLLQNLLIPTGTNKLIINFVVKFDTARFKETYQLDNGSYYFDLQSAHIAYCGLSGKQRELFKLWQTGKANYANKWAERTSQNNLMDTWKFHYKPLFVESDHKLTRNLFVTSESPQDLLPDLELLIEYTLKDVKITYELAQSLIPKYLAANPEIETLAGHLLLNKSILPVTSNWYKWLANVDRVWLQEKSKLAIDLRDIAKTYVQRFLEGDNWYLTDPWLSYLDWSVTSSGKNKGLPKWYTKTLAVKKGVKSEITMKSLLATYLLQITWKNQPVRYIVDYDSKGKKELKGWCYPCTSEDTEDDTQFTFEGVPYARIPHKDGEGCNCGNPLGKAYIGAFDNGLMSSPNELALSFLKRATSITYWESSRERVHSYKPHELTYRGKSLGYAIEPQLVAHGTSSRRCVERLWLTACQPKETKVGSELLSRVQAPNGYTFVGADFDTQELKIASLYSDAWQSFVLGSSVMSWSQIVGSKDNGTDPHSLLAKAQDIERDDAKPINFSVMYLSGWKAVASGLKALHPEWPWSKCVDIAKNAIEFKRGKKTRSGIYEGGTDSNAFNLMMALGNHDSLPSHLGHLRANDKPRTPLLNSAMSEAILSANCGGDFLTSRANWGIQSSGVDILHYTISLIDVLCQLENLEAHFVMSRHDEVWYMVKLGTERVFANIMQIASVKVWSRLALNLGFKTIPESYAWFSGINVDKCIRKEVYYGVNTVSNPDEQIENGYVLKPSDVLV